MRSERGKAKSKTTCAVYYQKNRDELLRKYVIRDRIRRQQLRLELCRILNQFSCVVCGIKDMRCLQFDHIHGNGNEDRKRFQPIRFDKFYKYYIAHPDEARATLQVLCANHNVIKLAETRVRNYKYAE